MQADFVKKFFQLREAGIHTALDTRAFYSACRDVGVRPGIIYKIDYRTAITITANKIILFGVSII